MANLTLGSHSMFILVFDAARHDSEVPAAYAAGCDSQLSIHTSTCIVWVNYGEAERMSRRVRIGCD